MVGEAESVAKIWISEETWTKMNSYFLAPVQKVCVSNRNFRHRIYIFFSFCLFCLGLFVAVRNSLLLYIIVLQPTHCRNLI